MGESCRQPGGFLARGRLQEVALADGLDDCWYVSFLVSNAYIELTRFPQEYARLRETFLQAFHGLADLRFSG